MSFAGTNPKRRLTSHLATTNKSAGTPDALAKLRAVQLDITPVQFEDAAEFKAAFLTTDQEVKRAAEASVDKQADVIVALAKMRSLLSQRGSKELRKKAGITQGWTQYFASFQRTYKLEMCLRTVINKIDVLSGKKLCKSCKKMNGHTPSCPRYKNPNPQLTVRECRLIAGLSAGHDLVQAIEQGGNFRAAANEYRRWAPTQERLAEWTDRQVLPYQPQSGDVIAVNGEEFSVLEVRGISDRDGAVQLLTLAVEPLHAAKVVPGLLTKTSETKLVAAGQRRPRVRMPVPASGDLRNKRRHCNDLRSVRTHGRNLGPLGSRSHLTK
jgi:hypothetical protein